MSERPVSIYELFAEELKKGIPIAALERTQVSYVELSDSEKDVIKTVFNAGLYDLRKKLPEVASDIEPQLSLATKMAGIAKATFPVRKNFTFPSVPGSLGAAWLFPQAIKWVATPTATDPCYTSYATDQWDISLTAGTAAWFFGDGTNFYKANRTEEQHTFLFTFHNGIVEYGSSPAVEQFRIISEGKMDYGIEAVQPLLDVPVERNILAYQYPTPLGALWITHDRGIMWGFMPRKTGTATIKLLGMVFYEHDFAPSLKWV